MVRKNGSEDTTWISSSTSDNWGFAFETKDSIGSIKYNDHKLISVPIVSPKNAEPGATYVFNVMVTYDDSGVSQPHPLREPKKKIRIKIL